MSATEPLPEWLSRRLHGLKRTGSLSLLRESRVCLSGLSQIQSYLQFIKQLDLTGTPIKSLEGLPKLPHLNSIKLDQTQLESLVNIEAVDTVSSISLKKTPLSEIPHYKLSIMIGTRLNVVKIDNQIVSEVVKKRASAYPSCARALVNKGWIVTFPKPSDDEFKDLCELYHLEIEEEEDNDDRTEINFLEPPAEEEDANAEDWDFDFIADKLWKQHEALMQRKQALFGVIEDQQGDADNEDEIGERIVSLFRLHNKDIPTDDRSILMAVDSLCRQQARRRSSTAGSD